MNNILPIPTFITGCNNPNYEADILKEFSGRNEFDLTILRTEDTPSIQNSFDTIRNIVKKQADTKTELVIIADRGHRFTSYYSCEHFLNCIKQSNYLNADILAGGITWLSTFIQASDDLFWSELFTGFQFIVIFRRFFETINNASFEKGIIDGIKLSTLANNGFLIYPFISGNIYSGDNSGKPELFNKGVQIIQQLKDIKLFYKSHKSTKLQLSDYQNITISTYVVNLKERTDRLKHITAQFEGRSEFDITIIEACRHKAGNVGLWLSIRKTIELAISNDDDVILICEDDHEFTASYQKELFVKNVFSAHEQGAGMLLGGIAHFQNAVQISEDTFWINMFYCTQFMIIYKSLFQRILDEPIEGIVTVDGTMSEITSNKLVIFPFISTQKFLGSSDITDGNSNAGELESMFDSTSKRLEKIKIGVAKYGQ